MAMSKKRKGNLKDIAAAVFEDYMTELIAGGAVAGLAGGGLLYTAGAASMTDEELWELYNEEIDEGIWDEPGKVLPPFDEWKTLVREG